MSAARCWALVALEPVWAMVRLYVAATMEKEPYLRTRELVKNLEHNDNPLVHEKTSKLKDKLAPE